MPTIYILCELTICYLYLEVLGPTPIKDWGALGSNDGVVVLAHQMLVMPKGLWQNVHNVFLAFKKCVKDGSEYDGMIKSKIIVCPIIIKPGSIKGLIIADWMEDSLGIQNKIIVDTCHYGQGMSGVTVSTVFGPYQIMLSEIIKMEKRLQGKK